MDPIESAILRTVLYADLFDFPLNPAEIQHFLIYDAQTTLEQITQTLDHSEGLRLLLTRIDDYIVYNGRAELVQIRQEREYASAKLWPQAVHYGSWLARLPFVRMVALTGALAMHNAADHDDDLDYILVTAPRRVWLARAFSIMLVRLARLRGAKICPNYVLSETALEQDKHDVFMAHEVAQMVPLYGHELYHQFRKANAWVLAQLPNSTSAYYQENEMHLTGFWSVVKQAFELLLGGGLGNWLESWEYQRKLHRFATDIDRPHSSAILDDSHVKGHFDDHGHPVLQRYYQRLKELDLAMKRVTAPGD